MAETQGNTEADAGFDHTSVEPGVWRYAKATRATLVVDGEDYFELMQRAMLNARRRILLIGWDFDTRIHLSKGRRWWQKGRRNVHPSRLGSFILWLGRHNPQLEIRILKWSYGVIKFAGRGSMAIDLLRWWPHRRIDFKFDTAHPVACCHHQKVVVIDDKFAVCGGIDMTTGRWDTREHLEHDDRRQTPRGAAQMPWHDMSMLMEGDVAATLAELGQSRWARAGGKPLEKIAPYEGSAWPDGLVADFENVEIGIARTLAPYGDEEKIDEIEDLFLRQIASARHFIYAESQYFASRTVCEAIAQRLSEPEPPEIVVINPETADGWVEAKAMDPARARMLAALRNLDVHDRFHIYVPYTGETPIYVHAKLLIVDDRILRVGSANLNNRSMGLDSECDVFIDCDRPGNEDACEKIRQLRHSLLAEHCDIADPKDVAKLLDKAGSMAGMIATKGASGRRQLRPLHPPEPGELEGALADRQVFDPEEPAELFEIRPPRRGLFRPGSLLSRSMRRIRRKVRRK